MKKNNTNIPQILFQKQKENEWGNHCYQILDYCQISQNYPNTDWKFFEKQN
jgi:hypothetical protein